MRSGVAGVGIVLALALALAAAPAHADGTAEAKERFDEAAKAYAEHRYADAAESYERAAALSPHPAPLVNAADAWELDGNFVRAARASDEALRLNLAGDVRAGLERRLARLERSIATLDVAGAAPLAARVDDGAVIAPPARLRLSPGRHVVAVIDGSAGTSRAETITLAPGEHRQLALHKDASPPTLASTASTTSTAGAEGPPPPPPRASGVPLGTWIAGGTAVAAAGGAVVFAVLTSSAQRDFDAQPSAGAADDFERKRTVTNVLIAVSGVALLTAGAIWLFAPRASATALSRRLLLSFD
jgi:hypothetical protein